MLMVAYAEVLILSCDYDDPSANCELGVCWHHRHDALHVVDAFGTNSEL
jgi:hypothetical protein